jgi:outer membrane protein OmpA-like peptidoglycan-associated protein
MEEIGQEKSLEKEGAPAILPEIYFATDSAEITPESEKRLERCWSAIQTSPYKKIVIEGHTDSTHTQEYNLELSRRRALAVAEWLIEQGLDANQVETRAYGESRPVADNKTEAGRALNRRVDILLQ